MQLHQYSLQRGRKSVLAEIARIGIDKFFEVYNEELILYAVCDDPVYQKKQARFNEQLNAIALAEGIPVNEFRGLKVVNDHYELKSYLELIADGQKEKAVADELEQVIFEEFKFD